MQLQNQACTCICIHTHSRVHLIYIPHTQKHMYANILAHWYTLNAVYSLDGTQNILHWNSRMLFNTRQLTFTPLQHILAWWCSKDIPQKCISLAYFWHIAISYHIHFQSTPHTHAMILKGHCIETLALFLTDFNQLPHRHTGIHILISGWLLFLSIPFF